MSQQEYLVTAVSLISALVLAKLLEGRHHALRGRLSALHAGWLINRLIAVLISFWGLSPARDPLRGTELTFERMLVVLTAVSFMLLAALTLVPDLASDDRATQNHYEEVRVPFLSLLIGTFVTNAVATYATGSSVPAWVFIAMLASAGVGLASAPIESKSACSPSIQPCR